MWAEGYWPDYSGGKWNGEWRYARHRIPDNSIRALRDPARYYIRDVERDLKPRTLAKVYSENRAGRRANGAYRPQDGDAAKAAYLAWAEERGHTPHPASLDPDHPINRWRLRAPPREKV